MWSIANEPRSDEKPSEAYFSEVGISRDDPPEVAKTELYNGTFIFHNCVTDREIGEKPRSVATDDGSLEPRPLR